MANCDFLSPLGGEVELAVHTIVLSRATGGTGVVDGNRLSPHSAPNMTVVVDLGRIRIAGVTIDATGGTATIGAASSTLCRIDLIIRTVTGTVQVVPGASASIEDPDNTGDWHSYTSPSPNDTIPDGAILGAVFIAAGVTSIGVNDIWMFAGKVEDWTDLTSAIALKHTQGTDQAIDSGGIYQSTASQIKGAVNHVGNTQNPHATTKTQVGLGNVVDYADITAANAPQAHATSHVSGSDIIPAAIAGGASGFLTGTDKTKLNSITATRSLEIIADGGGSVIPTGIIGDIIVEYACTITAWTVVAHTTGSIQFDVWRCTYSQYDDSVHPVVGDSIVASDPPAIVSGVKGTGTSLIGWTKTLAAGDVLRINVTSCTGITRATLSLKVNTT
jgi:hypothetical protein